MDLHIIGKSKVFDLFPRTDKGKNRCVLRKKYALINSRERTRIWLHTRHQSGAIEPCGDYCVDTKEKLVEILYFRHFAKHFTFTSEGKNSRNKHLKNYFDVSVVIDIGYGNTNEK